MPSLKVIRLCCLAPPCFLFWKFIASTLLVSLLLPLQNLWLQPVFGEHLNAKITRYNSEWVIESDIFIADQAYADASYQPLIAPATEPSRQPINQPELLTMGLVYTWLCLIAVFIRPQRYLLQGTLLSSIAILVAMAPVVYLNTIDLITAHEHLIALTDYNFVVVPGVPGTTTLAILRTIRDSLTFFSVLIFPALVTAWYTVKEKQKNRTIQKSRKKKPIKGKEKSRKNERPMPGTQT